MPTPTPLYDAAVTVARALSPVTRRQICDVTERARDNSKGAIDYEHLEIVAKAFREVMQAHGQE
jgi:hypothetical protein